MAKSKKDSTTSISSIPGPETESKEFDPGFIYIPLSHLKTTDPREQADNRPGLKLIDGVPSSAEILKTSSQVILYDNRTRNAAWVFEILNEQTLTEEANRPPFYEDYSEYYRSLEPGSETGYDTSHLAAADNHRGSQNAIDNTNLISIETWKMFEDHCRRLINEKVFQNLYVYTGPLYCPGIKNKIKIIEGKAVPTHFFKVIIKEKTEGKRKLECYKISNRKLNKDLMRYKTELKVIENLSGLVFSIYKQDSCFHFLGISGKPDFLYIPLSYLNPSVHPGEINNNRPGLKLIDGVPSFVEALKKLSHVIQYDNRTRNAAWVFEILNEQTITGEAERSQTYKIDEDIHEYYRAPESKKPYSGTDYHRGHLAAAINHKWSQKAMNDTNLLSNISPQHKKLNKRTWVKLENHCRRFIEKNGYQNVYVYTGPLYCPESDNEKEYEVKILGGKAVPTHFFKVIIKEKTTGERELECYKMPNRELPVNEIEDYTAELKIIEKLSGLVFSEKSQETRSKRVTVHMRAEKENKEITTEVQVIIPESERERQQESERARERESERESERERARE